MAEKFAKYYKYIILVILSAAFFCVLYGPAVLNPTYTDWLLGGADTLQNINFDAKDLTQHYLGWAAYRNCPWQLPLIGTLNNLSYPTQVSIIFTDSIPLFAVFFKILSPILPSEFQYFGIWGLMCFILQSLAAANILSRYSKSTVGTICLSLLFLLIPAMLFRMYLHTSLAAHWIILWNLSLLFNFKDYADTKKALLHAAAAAFIASSVHMYFILMCGIILTAFCAADAASGRGIKRSLLFTAAYISISAFTVFLLGGFASPMEITDNTFGFFGANLNTFINPQSWSRLFADQPILGSGQIEGMAYLGTGIGLLCLSIPLAAVQSRFFNFSKNKHIILSAAFVCIISFSAAVFSKLHGETQS